MWFHVLLVLGTLVPDYSAIHRAALDGTISGPEYARRLAGAIARPESLSPAQMTERVGRGICLTVLVRDALEGAQADEAARDGLARLFYRPPTQASFVSPLGFFTIHYDTTGDHAVYQPTVDVNPADGVPDYVNRCAEFFDRAWLVEVDSLGFDPPPSDNGLGGTDNYDVYLRHYQGAYGVTFPEGPSSQYPGRRAYYSHIFVDPTYNGFGYANRLLPLMVTAAHEFQHACQFAYDTFEDGAWMEHCATWAEDVVFDHVNDYLSYLPYFLNYPHKALYLFDDLYPYGACVWAHFLDQRYGGFLIERIWEKCITSSAQQAVDLALRDIGSNRDAAVAEFRVWNYFTGSRDDGAHYEEGASWPLVPLMSDHQSLPVLDGAPLSGQTPGALACNYVRFRSLAVDSLRLRFQGQADRTWAASLIVLAEGPSPQQIGAIPLSGGEGMAVTDLTEASTVIMIPTCLSLGSGTYTYWARNAYELVEISNLTFVERMGDGDSRIEPGEGFGIGASLLSVAAQWENGVLSVASDDPAVLVVDGEVVLGPVGYGQTLTIDPQDFLIEVSPAVGCTRIPLRIGVGPYGQPPFQHIPIVVQVGTPPLLLVDDDGGLSTQAYVTASLDSLGMLHDVWDNASGLFPAYPLAPLDLDAYDEVVWITGNAGNALDAGEVALCRGLLDAGRHLLLSGQDIAESLSTFPEGQAFLADAGVTWDGRETSMGVVGVADDPVFGTMRFYTAGSGLDGANNQTSRDRLQPAGESVACLAYQSGRPAGVRGTWAQARFLFLGFGVEAVVDNHPSVNTRREFLAAALDYLRNGVSTVHVPGPSSLSIVQVWPNPTSGVLRARVAPCATRGLEVWLVDMAGRAVARLYRTGGEAPPLLSLAVPAHAPSGSYVLRFEANGSRTTVPVTLIR